jgi:transcriptional regulator with XRE-family HTH domain
MHNQKLNLKEFLKNKLTKKKMTYKDISKKMNVSETTVKRWMTQQDIKLDRLIHLSQILEFSIFDFVNDKFSEPDNFQEYSYEQEMYFVKNPNSAYIFLKLRMGYSLQKICRTLNYSKHQILKVIAEMEKIKVLELWPDDKIVFKLYGPFRFVKNGPNENFYLPLFIRNILAHFSNLNSRESERTKQSPKLQAFEMYLTKESSVDLFNELQSVVSKYRILSRYEYTRKADIKPFAGAIALDQYDAWKNVFLSP